MAYCCVGLGLQAPPQKHGTSWNLQMAACKKHRGSLGTPVVPFLPFDLDVSLLKLNSRYPSGTIFTF